MLVQRLVRLSLIPPSLVLSSLPRQCRDLTVAHAHDPGWHSQAANEARRYKRGVWKVPLKRTGSAVGFKVVAPPPQQRTRGPEDGVEDGKDEEGESQAFPSVTSCRNKER